MALQNEKNSRYLLRDWKYQFLLSKSQTRERSWD